MIGVTIDGQSKAYPLKLILAAKSVQDQVGEVPILIVVGSEGSSVGIFISRLGTSPMTFTFAVAAGSIMRDAETESDWNFEGCATSGKLEDQYLQAIDGNNDYWSDWLNHPNPQLLRG